MSAATRSFASRAEVFKLARLLGADAQAFVFLESQEATAIRALREQMTARLFDDGRPLLQKLATATRLTPTSISAVIAEKALGPLLCARVASLLGVEKAIDISKRLSAAFLAEVCLHLDPRRSADIIRGTPIAQVVEVAALLQADGEFVTMARFVDALSTEAIKAVIAATPDEATLLRTAVFAENPALHEELVKLLPQARLQRLVVAAAGDAELWAALLSMSEYLAPATRSGVAGLTAALDDPALAATFAHAASQGLMSLQLLLISACRGEARSRWLAAAKALKLDAALRQALDALTD